MATTTTYGALSASDHSAQLRKAVIASTIGTAIEWYDFFLYGTAAGLIFGKLFFPGSDPLTATLLSFGTYFIGFVGRPVLAAIFGHYGDRIGRKATLIATLLCMGIATFLVAGVPCGLFLANLAVLAFSQLSGDQFAPWGWRIPFALSIILVGMGLWIRLGILETPVFQQLLNNKKIEKAPIIEVFKKHPKEIFLSAFLRVSEQAPFYIFTAFIFAYAVGTLHMSRDLILIAVLVASCLSFITIPLSGHISDRIGRRKMYLIGAATTGLFGFLYFGMVDTAIPTAVFIAIVLSLIPHDMQYGPQAALIAEAFTPRLRYSGASLGYQLAAIIAGGPAPLIATALFAAYHSGYAISIYIAACAVVSLVAASFMPDYTGKDISVEYDD